MKNRREFLKDAACGAVLLGSAVTAEQSAMAAVAPTQERNARSRVVVAREARLHESGQQPGEQQVLALLDKAMAAYTGEENSAAAWKRLIPRDKVIGLKVNGLGGRGIATHAVLILAVCERLQQAGVPAGSIVVWDRNARDLQACGMTINTDRNRIRCYGSDTAGFEEAPVACGSAELRLSKILTRDCDMVISMPILKDHGSAGLTFSMKNMYGVVDRPDRLHANNCNPGVAALNAVPAVRNKVRLTIGDALSSVYQGGPGFHPEHLWYPNALIVGEDRVAVDQCALQMLDGKRVEAGLPTLQAAGRQPAYIATAANAPYRLGNDNPQRIHLLEV